MPIHSISIGGCPTGPDRPPYNIAELSANHYGKVDRALEMIVAAKEAAADAVKLQIYATDTLPLDRADGGPDAAFSLELCDLAQGARTGWAYPPKKHLLKVIGNRASATRFGEGRHWHST